MSLLITLLENIDIVNGNKTEQEIILFVNKLFYCPFQAHILITKAYSLC